VSTSYQAMPPATTSYVQGAAGYPAGSRVIGGTVGSTVRTAPATTTSISASQVVRPGTSYISAGTATGTTSYVSAGYQPARTVQAAPTQSVTYRTVGASGVPTYSYGQPTVTTVAPTTISQGTYSLGQYSQGAYETKHRGDKEDPQLKNLKDLRSSCGLKYVPVGEGLKSFKAAADDNKLSRPVFISAYESLLKNYGIEVPAESVKNAVFDLFDRDDNGVVDMMELICGISLLCQGSEEDKIHAVFEIFDENGDGFISMDEMFKFLTSVFKVVLTPNVMGVMRSMGVEVESAEDLASVTALECFKAADLNQDGKLSITEFKEWFYAPKNDPSFLFSPMRKLLQ